MKQRRQAVCVDTAEVLQVLSHVLADMARTLSGAEPGMEDASTFGVEKERLALYEAVEQAKQPGVQKVRELLVWDLIGVPVRNAAPDEPGWYLTVSLNAEVK